MTTYGLVPAGGKSRRMGTPKLLLPTGGATVLERVVACLHDASVSEVIVVAGPADEELAGHAEAIGAIVARLPADTPDMRATCLFGLGFIERRFRPGEADGWLVLPADHPTLRPPVVRAVLEAALQAAGQAIIVPTHAGRRGHPTWLPWKHAGQFRQSRADEGLNRYIRAQAGQTRELPWPSDEILLDLDTPEDYARLLASLDEPEA